MLAHEGPKKPLQTAYAALRRRHSHPVVARILAAWLKLKSLVRKQ